MGRINTYPETTSPGSDDFLLLDGTTSGTRKIKPVGLMQDMYTEDISNWHFTGGYIDANKNLSGGQNSVNLEVVSELISVRYGFKYKFTLTHTEAISNDMWIAIAEYDENYDAVGSRFSRQPAASVLEYDFEYSIVNTNARYIRVSYRTFGGLVKLAVYRNVVNDQLTQNEKIDLSIDPFTRFKPYNFVIGSAIVQSNVVSINSNEKKRVTSKGWMTFDKPCVISANPGYRIYVYYKLPNDDTVYSITWGRFLPINKANTEVWFTIQRYPEDSTETLSSVDEFVNNVYCSDAIECASKDWFGFYDDLIHIVSNFDGINRYNQCLALPGVTGYINYDSVNERITIPKDTLLIGYNADGNGKCWKALNSSQEVVIENVNASTYNSAALKLSVNINTSEFTLKRYADPQEPNEYLIAAMRIKSGTRVMTMVSPSAWSIDGKPYNIDIPIASLIAAPQALIKSINHRGWNNVAPENTLEAFKLSSKNGFKYVETDVCFTSDNVAVLLHDGTINRTARNADGTEIVGDININDITYAQALEYDFGIWKSSAYAGTKIPTLDEFCSLCKKLGLHPYIELKSGYGSNQQNIESAVAIAYNHGLKGNCTFISFNATWLNVVKSVDSSARLGFLSGASRDVIQSDITVVEGLKTSTNEVFINASLTNLTDTGVEMCISSSIPLEVYSGNATNILTMHDYITGVTTDNVVSGTTIYNYNID